MNPKSFPSNVSFSVLQWFLPFVGGEGEKVEGGFRGVKRMQITTLGINSGKPAVQRKL